MYFSLYIPLLLPFSYKFKLRKDRKAQAQKKRNIKKSSHPKPQLNMILYDELGKKKFF